MTTKKISKSLAESVAKELCSLTLGKQVKAIEQKMQVIADTIISSKIPIKVQELYKKHPDYFVTATNCLIRSISDEQIRMGCSKHASKNSWTPLYDCDDEVIFRQLFEFDLELQRLNKLIRKSRNDIAATLISLSSFKKIESNFPEAYALIPTEYLNETEVALAIPIQSLRDILGINQN